jgi:hypothetical protein
MEMQLTITIASNLADAVAHAEQVFTSIGFAGND